MFPHLHAKFRLTSCLKSLTYFLKHVSSFLEREEVTILSPWDADTLSSCKTRSEPGLSCSIMLCTFFCVKKKSTNQRFEWVLEFLNIQTTFFCSLACLPQTYNWTIYILQRHPTTGGW